MKMPKAAATALSLVLALSGLSAIGSTPSSAQIKPYSADDPSFNAPEMRRHGSGLHRPNRPHRHHHHHRSYSSHSWRSRF